MFSTLCTGYADPPSDGLYMYDGGLTVDLEWTRPAYTGGDGVTVDEYTVSANGQSVTVSDSSEVVRYTSSGLIYGVVLMTSINSCDLESQSTEIIIPASGLCLMPCLLFMPHCHWNVNTACN